MSLRPQSRRAALHPAGHLHRSRGIGLGHGGNLPADLSQSPLVGRWAGKRVLVQGDYAEDDDLPGWDGAPLSTLYSALRDKEDEKPDPGQPVFADLSDEVAAFLEGACSVRFFKATWGSSYCVAVKPVARAFGGSGVAEYVIDTHYSADDLAFCKRVGMRPIDVQRPPRSGDWHSIRPDEVAEGQRRDHRQPRHARIPGPGEIRPGTDPRRHARLSRPAALAKGLRKGRSGVSAVSPAGPGPSSAPRSRHSGPAVCGAMGKPAICPDTVRPSTARCCKSSSPPTPARA